MEAALHSMKAKPDGVDRWGNGVVGESGHRCGHNREEHAMLARGGVVWAGRGAGWLAWAEVIIGLKTKLVWLLQVCVKIIALKETSLFQTVQ